MPQPSIEITIAVGTKADAILAMFEDYSDGAVSRESVVVGWLGRWSRDRVLPEVEDAPAATEVTVAIDERLDQCLRHYASWARIEPEALASKIINARGGWLYDRESRLG